MSLSPSRTLDALQRARIVPVVVIDDASRAVALANALAAGGIRCAEITLRTSGGIAAIAAVSALDDFVVGAGTVLTADDVDACVDAGAEFIVSPGLDASVVSWAKRRGVLPLPGVATASEIQQAMKLGLDAVKFFPADRLGGLGTIAALSQPFPGMKFMPSGGITTDNALEYLAHPKIFAVGGSWMVPRALINAGDFAEITRLAAAASALVTPVTPETEPAPR